MPEIEIATQTCGSDRHPEVVIRFDPDRVPEADAKWLVQTLEEMVARGSKLQPGQTLQIGWNVVMVGPEGKGRLTLRELDFSGEPGQFTPSITRSLVTHRAQMNVLESFGLVGRAAFPSLRQSAIRCLRFGSAGEVYLARSEPSVEDSGWFFGCRDEEHNHHDPRNLESDSLYKFACGRPEVIEFLAMPPGHIVLLGPSGYEGACDTGNDELSIVPGSYLDVKQGRNL